MGLAGAKHAHAADRVVAGQQNHLNTLLLFGVEGQQLFDQRKRHAGRSGDFNALALQAQIGAGVAVLKDLVFFLKVKQRTRGNSDDQLVVQRDGHGDAARLGQTSPSYVGWRVFCCALA